MVAGYTQTDKHIEKDRMRKQEGKEGNNEKEKERRIKKMKGGEKEGKKKKKRKGRMRQILHYSYILAYIHTYRQTLTNDTKLNTQREGEKERKNPRKRNYTFFKVTHALYWVRLTFLDLPVTNGTPRPGVRAVRGRNKPDALLIETQTTNS